MFAGNSPFVVVVLTNLWTGKINERNPIIYSDDDNHLLLLDEIFLANRNPKGRKRLVFLLLSFTFHCMFKYYILNQIYV